MLWVGTAQADVTADQAGAILVFPKLVFDGSAGVDTVIQVSNTSDELVNVRCFYVNANSHCSNEFTRVCATNEDCGSGICLPGWQETDFRFTLTAYQPIEWTLSEGMPFFPLDGFNRIGVGGQANVDSSIPRAPENPFYGELKCVQVGDDESPVDSNSLKGEATIVRATTAAPLDARGYNALGIQAVEGANDGDNTLVLGEEYNGCPNILILDHFFDDAREPINDSYVRTHLTLVPCSQNFVLQDQALFDTTVQFLVYNEFEQRFSASIKIRCFKEIALSDIDTRPRSLGDATVLPTDNDLRSIFNVNVQGTLTGQTRIRGVDDGSDSHGNGLLGVAEEFHRASMTTPLASHQSAAFNIHQAGERATTDVISLP
jgi:hypothetical protein